MASSSINKAFTLVESLVVIFLFTIAIVLGSQIYFNLTKTSIQAQDIQLALNNVHLAAEKIWVEIKLGSDFKINKNDNSIEFKNSRCQNMKIFKKGENENKNLFFQIENKEIPIFDNSLVSFRDFRIYSDQPSNSGFYYQTANKIFVFEYDVELKTKNFNTPFKFRQAVSPLNSIFLNPPCK